MWADLGENEGWRDPAQRSGRAFGQVRGPSGARASARGMEDIQAGGGQSVGVREGVREALGRVEASVMGMEGGN